MKPIEATAPPASKGATRADVAFATLHLMTWIAAALQALIDPGYENLICTALVLASATLTFVYVRRSKALREVPLSTMAVLGLCITTQWGALVAQSALWDSLTISLRVPLHTFGYLLMYQSVAVAAHWTSRRMSIFMSARRIASDTLLAPLGIFQVPAVPAVWAIGCFGVLCFVLGYVSEGGLIGKIADGLGVFAWAPFTIPLLHHRYGRDYCDLRRQAPFLALFALLAVLLGLALNFRKVMLIGTMTAALLYFLILLDDERPFRLKQLRWVALCVLVGTLLFEPLTYFFTAVQVAREQRDKLSRLQMIEYTLEVLQNPAAIRLDRDKGRTAADVDLYDEYYFRSSMIGRLVEIKFHDNGFYMVQGVSAQESRLIAEDALDRVVSVLPFPVLKWMGFERSKFVTLYSVGDLLAYTRLGVELGAFRTGSMFAQGLAIFGVWTPFLYFLLCIPVFVVWDVLGRISRHGAPVMLSLVGMLLIYRVFAYGIVAESVGNLAGVLLRFQLQNVLLYAALYAATRTIWRPFSPASSFVQLPKVAGAGRAASGAPA